LVWVWVLKIPPKNPKFFNFSEWVNKNLFGLGQKSSRVKDRLGHGPFLAMIQPVQMAVIEGVF